MIDDMLSSLGIEVMFDGRRRLHVLKPRGGWPTPLRFARLWRLALLLRFGGASLRVEADGVWRQAPLFVSRMYDGCYMVTYRGNRRYCAGALDALRFVVVEFNVAVATLERSIRGRRNS